MDLIQEVQELEYEYPYHHLVETSPFSQTKHLFWGYRYAAYIEKIMSMLTARKFDSLVDIGCGDGRVLKEIAQRFPGKRLVGLDYSEKSLSFAKAFSPDLTFETGTDELFDSFLLIEVIEHISPLGMESFLAGVCQNLKEGAFGIITTPCDNVALNPKHYQHFNRTSIEETLSAHFDIVSLEYISADTLGTKIIQRLLANKLFILNEKRSISYLYSLYKERYLNATERNATQLCVLVRKKSRIS